MSCPTSINSSRFWSYRTVYISEDMYTLTIEGHSDILSPVMYIVKSFISSYSLSVSMVTHVSHLVSTCCYQLLLVRAITWSIPSSMAVQLINCFVLSCINYCNSLLAGLPAYQLDRVQSILNFSTRLMYGRATYDHVTPILRDKLHWLRIPQRIQYMCCLLVYKALHGLMPSYILNFCTRV